MSRTCPADNCEATIPRHHTYRCPRCGADLAGDASQNSGRDSR